MNHARSSLVAVAVVLAVGVLTGCQSRAFRIVNQTDERLEITLGTATPPSVYLTVGPNSSANFDMATRANGCDPQANMSAIAADGTVVAERMSFCKGETWVIAPPP